MEGLLTKLRIPEGLPQVLEALARGVIRHQPEDIYAFAADLCQQLWDEECRKENKSPSAPLPAPSSPKLRSSASNEDAQPLLSAEHSPASPDAELALPLDTTRNEEFGLGEEDFASSPRQSPENTEDVAEKAASPISTIAKLKTLESPRSIVLVSRPASAASIGSQLRQSLSSRPASVESKTLKSSSRPVSAIDGRISAGAIRSLAASPTSPVPQDSLAGSPTSDKPKLLDDGDAAVLIQAAYRGYRTRRSLAAKTDPLETNSLAEPSREEPVNEKLEDQIQASSDLENDTADVAEQETITLGSPRGQADEEGAEGLDGTANDALEEENVNEDAEEEKVNEDAEEDYELPAQENDTIDPIIETELAETVTLGSPREQVEAEDGTGNDAGEPGLERMPTADEEEEIWRKIQRDISLEDETQARAATKIQSSFRGYRVRRDLNADTHVDDSDAVQADIAAEPDDSESNIDAVDEENSAVNLEDTGDAALAQQNDGDSPIEAAEVTQERPETEIDENADEVVQENADATDTTETVVLAEDAEILEILQVGHKFPEETDVMPVADESERLVLQMEDGVTDADRATAENNAEELLTGQAADTDRSTEEEPQICDPDTPDQLLNDETEVIKVEDEIQTEVAEEVNGKAEEDIQNGESESPAEPKNDDTEPKEQDEIQVEEIEGVNDVIEANDLGTEPESLILADNAEILNPVELEDGLSLEEIQQLGGNEESPADELSGISSPVAELEAGEESVLLIDTEQVAEESQLCEPEQLEVEIAVTEAEVEIHPVATEVLEEVSTVGLEDPAVGETVLEGGLPDEDLIKDAEDTDLADPKEAETVVTDQNDAEQSAETESVAIALDQEDVVLTPVLEANPETEEVFETELIENAASSTVDFLDGADSESHQENVVGDEVHVQEQPEAEGIPTDSDIVGSVDGEEAADVLGTDVVEADAGVEATVNVEDGAAGTVVEDQPTEGESVQTEEIANSVVVEAAEPNLDAPDETICLSPATEELLNVEANGEPLSSLVEDAPADTLEEGEMALEDAEVRTSSALQTPRESEPDLVQESSNEEVIVADVHAPDTEENNETENVEENETIVAEEIPDSVVVEAADPEEEMIIGKASDEQPSSLVEDVPASMAEEDLDVAKDGTVERGALIFATEDVEESIAVVEPQTDANVDQALECEAKVEKQGETEEPPPEYCSETMVPLVADVADNLDATEHEAPADDETAVQVSETTPETDALTEAKVQATETAEGTNVVEAVEEIEFVENSTEVAVVESDTPKLEDDSEQDKEENTDGNGAESLQATSPENSAETALETEAKEDEAQDVAAESNNQIEEVSDSAAADTEPTESCVIESDVQEESLVATPELESLVEINQDLVTIEDSPLTTTQEINVEGGAEQEVESTPAEALNVVNELSESEQTPPATEPVVSPVNSPTNEEEGTFTHENPTEVDDNQEFLHRIVKLENGAEVLVIHHDEQSATDLDNDTHPTAVDIRVEDDASAIVDQEGPVVDEALASLTETITKVAMFLTSPAPATSEETPASPTGAETEQNTTESTPVIEEKIVLTDSLECVPPATAETSLISLIEDERSLELVIQSTEADNNAGIVEATWSPRPSPTEEVVVLENQHKILDKIEEVHHVLGAFTCVIEDLSDDQPPPTANSLVTDLDDPEWSDCSDAHSSQPSRSSSPYNMQYLDPYYDGAATKIQANYRGYRTRQNLKRRKGLKTLNDNLTSEGLSNNAHYTCFEELPTESVGVGNEPGSPASEKDDMLNSAATKIQARYRGYRTRHELSKTNPDGATWTELQSRARGKVERDAECDQTGWEADKAATKIQAGVRGFLVRRRQDKAKVLALEESDTIRNNMHVSASPKCVSLPRGFEHRRGSLPEFQRKHWNKLTSDDRRGSAPFLRLLTRTDSGDGRRQAAAALKIQSVFRGYRVRKHRPSKTAAKTEMRDEDTAEDKAATKIQARYRGYRTRSGLKQVESSSADKCDDQVVKAVQIIQAGFRGYKVRKDMGLLKPRSQTE